MHQTITMKTRKQQPTLDEMLKTVGNFSDYDHMLIPDVLRPVDTNDGDQKLGELNNKQIRIFILIHLLELQLVEKRTEIRDLIEKNNGEPEDEGLADKTEELADKIEHLEWMIPLLKEKFWLEMRMNFCNSETDSLDNRLAVRWYYILVIEKPKKKDRALRIPLPKALVAILQYLRPRCGGVSLPAYKSKYEQHT